VIGTCQTVPKKCVQRTPLPSSPVTHDSFAFPLDRLPWLTSEISSRAFVRQVPQHHLPNVAGTSVSLRSRILARCGPSPCSRRPSR
jgi:hypothetical protein